MGTVRTPFPGMTGAAAPPRCPITGLPALRHIQWVSSRLLTGLWRVSFGVSAAGQLHTVGRFGLWESPCGLAFFDPPIAGDAEFYRQFYDRLRTYAAARAHRPDFARAAAAVRAGDKVLDVGCGEARFAPYVPHATYVGLEPTVPVEHGPADIRSETVSQHAACHAGAYDVVCSFQVVEHVPDPLGFAEDMVRCLKPGGRLFLGVPSWPSPMTAIPNFVLNAPPHHLSWWTESALTALAERLGLVTETVEETPVGDHIGILYWMGRMSPKLTGERFFAAAWPWYMGLVLSWISGRICNALLPLPPRARPIELMLVARKPG